jgi:hypothetical protein
VPRGLWEFPPRLPETRERQAPRLDGAVHRRAGVVPPNVQAGAQPRYVNVRTQVDASGPCSAGRRNSTPGPGRRPPDRGGHVAGRLERSSAPTVGLGRADATARGSSPCSPVRASRASVQRRRLSHLAARSTFQSWVRRSPMPSQITFDRRCSAVTAQGSAGRQRSAPPRPGRLPERHCDCGAQNQRQAAPGAPVATPPAPAQAGSQKTPLGHVLPAAPCSASRGLASGGDPPLGGRRRTAAVRVNPRGGEVRATAPRLQSLSGGPFGDLHAGRRVGLCRRRHVSPRVVHRVRHGPRRDLWELAVQPANDRILVAVTRL